jgi:lysophospholipase L1-like esterase
MAMLRDAMNQRTRARPDRPSLRARARRWFVRALVAVISLCAVLLTGEGALRLVFHLPEGKFESLAQSSLAFYRPNSLIRMTWGPVPYAIRTNALGLRGRPIQLLKPVGSTRIVALGDSITDGFFVDEEDTFPWLLQDILDGQGSRVEVINAAVGGGSIDRELAILRGVGTLLHPDVVLLTFVTNDISDIRERTARELVSMQPLPVARSLSPQVWLLTRTAVGELALDAFLRLASRSYRAHESTVAQEGAARYRIPGGGDFAENERLFLERFGTTDGLVLEYPLSQEVEGLVRNYVAALGEMEGVVDRMGASLVFVYFPAYPQVYDPRAPMQIRDRLEEACRGMGIPFVDLTASFRGAGERRVLHLAPLDFHLNPDGYRVIAEGIASFLKSRGLVPPR